MAENHGKLTRNRQVGDEIQGFKLDMSSPMTPFSITGFKSRGPAQEAGHVSWFLASMFISFSSFLHDFDDFFGDFVGRKADLVGSKLRSRP